MKFKNSKFIKSAYKISDYPNEGCPEFALVGRSNVGKSSLINALTNSKTAKVSGSPGKTRLINFFSINDDSFRIVDLPGYGFAKVSKTKKGEFNEIIDTYLKNRNSLKKIIVLLDIRRDVPSDDDLVMLNYINYYKLGGIIAFTKCDKLNKSNLAKNENAIKKYLTNNGIDIKDTEFVRTSALSKDGIKNLFALLSNS